MNLKLCRHGDKCAGVIAAVLNNSYCGVGLAYKAKVGGKALALINCHKSLSQVRFCVSSLKLSLS